MRQATSDFLKSLSSLESLEKGKVLITHLGGSWKCGNCGYTQEGYDHFTCDKCGHDSAGPQSKHVFTKDHVSWYHDMEAKEASSMPHMAKSLGVKSFLEDLLKHIPCANEHDDRGAGDHGPKAATHIVQDYEGISHPLCANCVANRRIIGRGLIYGTAKPITYGEPGRNLHSDVAINAYNHHITQEEKQSRDGRHTGGGGSLEKYLGVQDQLEDLLKYLPCAFSHRSNPENNTIIEHEDGHPPREATYIVNHPYAGDIPVCAHCAQRLNERAYVRGTLMNERKITYGEPDRPHMSFMVEHLAAMRQAKRRGSLGKSLGYQELIDELRKSPRRTLKHPPEGMPDSMHASWYAYNGVSPAVMKLWKEPSHEMHHAYLAKEWTRKHTNLQRYGSENPNQRDQSWLASEHGKKWSGEKQGVQDHMTRIATEHREHMAKINAHESMKHVPEHVAASREAYIKEKTSAHDEHGVRVGGVAHLNYEQGNELLNALGRYHKAGKMSEKEHLRTQNLKENFHDFADSHEENYGTYDTVKFPVVHMHPGMLELSHRAMQAHSDNKQAKSIIRHANDAAELHKP